MNRTLWKHFVCIGLTGFIFAFNARAWDATGHMLVAQIAHDRLNEKAREKVDALAAKLEEKGVTYNAVSIACWPDDIKSKDSTSPHQGQFRPWHYVDIGCRPTDPDVLGQRPLLEPTKGDVIASLNLCADLIRTHRTDSMVPKEEVALALLMHFVGDIHQPLHTTARYNPDPKPDDKYKDDAGGNGVSLANLDDTPWGKNLHTFWDESYRRFYENGRIKAMPELKEADVLSNPATKDWLKRLEPDAPRQPNLDFDPKAWALEVHEIACAHVYGDLNSPYGAKDVVLSKKYVEDSAQIARKQIVLAGYRLAALLNDLYGK